ncbi:hypothetical protein WMZ97_03920 [Lentibacillus sp. N15]|uniref:hypothetical protein n=1 Tax=Lentibacillus songyuanensis TaxID=3136161 RepID=UPI0031BB5846
MSDNKKVIHVKDLVIKADNVHLEPEYHRPRFDPFFGRMVNDRRAYEEPVKNEQEIDEEVEQVHDQELEDDNKENRAPFSWI